MVSFVGINSVVDRTLFTDKGPIIKRPLELLTGNDLTILSSDIILINSGNFSISDVGKLLAISGSLNGRNDGTFPIKNVISSQRLQLDFASFNTIDEIKTNDSAIILANDIKKQYNLHRTSEILIDAELQGIHIIGDSSNIVTAPDATDLNSCITLLNDIMVQFNAHVIDLSVHTNSDIQYQTHFIAADKLASAILLANDVRKLFELHRQNRFVHEHADTVDRILINPIRAIRAVFPHALIGPLTWILKDPRSGIVADDPYDVEVIVNGSPVAVDAVFGALGAVVLSQKPSGSDSVSISYDYINNPPSRFLRLNAPEFVFNQIGSRAHSGFPQHQYRARSYLLQPGPGPDYMAPVQPMKRAWKYKALERAYTAVLNDPNTLLLNVPTNKLAYPILFDKVVETTIRYDPVTLPQNAIDAWQLSGDGLFSLAAGGSQLTILDPHIQSGVDSKPPFFYHGLEIQTLSTISGAFRVRMSPDPTVFSTDGVFSGVAFGISDGQKVVVAGLLLTHATGLSSAKVLVNQLKSAFNLHLTSIAVHEPNDIGNIVNIVDATDLPSLIVLVNKLRTKYINHISKGSGSGQVHNIVDGTNTIIYSDATDLETAVLLANELHDKYNLHIVQSGIHFINDSANSVDLVRQIGLLSNHDFPEFAESWISTAVDWTDYRTFRIFIDKDGNGDLFLSGDVQPSATIEYLLLPNLSDLEARFDLIQQIFFGSISREAKNSSDWQFVRANIQPLDSNLIGHNKQITYDGSIVPELDPLAPWITYGQGGTERISSNKLVLDSTSNAGQAEIAELGLVSGAYRGFIRFEPILTANTSIALEFAASADYWTHGLTNTAMTVVLDDSDFSIQLSFLQFSPSPAMATGSITEPFTLVTNDNLVLAIDGANPHNVVFSIPPNLNTASGIAATINSVVGFPFASDEFGKLKFVTSTLGADAQFSIISGSALAKLGFSPGMYFGSDSNPEPKLSWFGANFPDQDNPQWTRTGDQTTELLGRVLRITDVAIDDYVVYKIRDLLITNQAFNPVVDWKLDVRLRVLSFDPGVAIPASGPYQILNFIGALITVDEGPSGKQVELQLAVNASGVPFINLLSYNSTTGSLDVISQYAFNWNDGRIHTYNIYTSKASNSIFILADGQTLTSFAGPTPMYSSLNTGISGPEIAFGSGTESVTAADLRVAQSVVDWHSVAIFRDSKIGDVTAASRRYIGVYRGGSVEDLNSYYLHNVDWSIQHIYRIVRDPVSGVSVYIDGGTIPIISISYDVLSLPPVSSSFLRAATGTNSAIAFGSFNPTELARSRWDYVKYSLGKITLTDNLIPPHQILNQSNVVASPEHLYTNQPHQHAGFRVYSGGTPIDEFMSNPEVPAYTVLGAGTPPVPATQNLESRYGLIKTSDPLNGISVSDIINSDGFITDLIDDDINAVSGNIQSITSVSNLVIATSNNLKNKYTAHRVQIGVHNINDSINTIVASNATDVPTACVLLNDIKTKFNLHLAQAGVHTPDDGLDIITASDAIDIITAIRLINDVLQKFQLHLQHGQFHLVSDNIDIINEANPTDISSAALLASILIDKFSNHTQNTTYHVASDIINGNFAHNIPGVGNGQIVLFQNIITDSNISPGQLIQFLNGPNAGQARYVRSQISNNEYELIPNLTANDSIGSKFVRLGFHALVQAQVLDISTIRMTDPPIPVQYGDTIMFLDGPNAGQERMVISFADANNFTITPDLFTPDLNVRSMTRIRNPSSVGVDPANIIAAANNIIQRFNSHLDATNVHLANDIINIVALDAAVSIADAYGILTAVKAAFNIHLSGLVFHQISDVVNNLNIISIADSEQNSIQILNDVRMAYMKHIVSYRVHLADDIKYTITIAEATDLASGIILANHIKKILNLHYVARIKENQKVHSNDDSVNIINTPNATDLSTFVDLVQAILTSYNAHRTQTGVHGSSLFIRLDVPNGVLYDSIKFWITEEGNNTAIIAPFSDDETLYWDGSLSNTKTISRSYSGSVLPNNDAEAKIIGLANNIKDKYNAHRTQTGVHVTDDIINIVTAVDATDLASAIMLLLDIQTQFNLHLVALGIHTINDTLDKSVVNIPTEIKTATSLAVELRLKLTAHEASAEFHPLADIHNIVNAEDPSPVQNNGWTIYNNGLGTVTESLITEGPISAFRYGTSAPGVQTAYRLATGLPDTPSLKFEMRVTMRVNQFTAGPNIDTGIYVGLLSNAGIGAAAAIGFDTLSGIPYVKIQDVNANVPVFRAPFEWTDGQFHTYRLVRDNLTNSFRLVIDN
jgi:hypothetical protein